MRVACIGECMIELVEQPDGSLRRGYGGDTLNTAVYLARLGVDVDYVTAMGTDPWSEDMVGSWRAEGVGTDRVLRTAARNPGLYVVSTDADGERRFQYWRDTSAARTVFHLPESRDLIEALTAYDLVYLSGITLQILAEEDHTLLFGILRRVGSRGGRVAFDSNFRPRGWPDKGAAVRAYADVIALADIVLASVEDLDLLYGPGYTEDFVAAVSGKEAVLKRPNLDCRLLSPAGDTIVAGKRVPDVLDTTAAGDSFAAAYLAARLSGLAPSDAAAAGHRLAGEVVRHRGAIIPAAAMPEGLLRSSVEGTVE